MFNNRGGKKRGIPIYSLLTIIVLISISGGCRTRDRIEIGRDAGEAGLLVDAEIIKHRDKRYVGWDAVSKEEIGKTQEVETYIDNITIDRKKVTGSHHGPGGGGWVELSPGTHKYYYEVKIRPHSEIRISSSIWYPGLKCSWSYWGDINVEPHKVYAVTVHINYENPHTFIDQHTKKKKYLDLMTPEELKSEIQIENKIICVPYNYEQTSGVVKHPTDSKLSFKLKE